MRSSWSTGTRWDGWGTTTRPSSGAGAGRACFPHSRRSRSSAATAPRSATSRRRLRARAVPLELVLRTLRIENLVLIHDAELVLDERLTAITGETGAGKTIFSNAVGLLLWARGDAALIGAGGA